MENKPKNFNPRSPCGERRSVHRFVGITPFYFNPRSPCGERPHSRNDEKGHTEISIHAPRAGSDKQADRKT